ncbi:hypothetical protein ABDK96_09995 [Citricoccus nitrophenolicus]|uniref:DUF4230 domain-containing protein n=1 Tax=Citricoccus nitrophenolicus TaxID=863575 RepID=A0ABV0IIL6_9MICC
MDYGADSLGVLARRWPLAYSDRVADRRCKISFKAESLGNSSLSHVRGDSQKDLTPMTTKSPRRSLPWLLTAVCLLAVLLLGAMILFPKADLFGVETRSRNTEVINSVTGIQEVALVGLGIEGIEERSTSGTFDLPLTTKSGALPGSDRARYLKYKFTAKLGVDGSTVKINKTGEDSFRITIPEFKVIGIKNPVTETVVEDNGVLSWLTPEIKESDISNDVLSDEAHQKYLDDYEELLRDQAESYYGGIVKSVAPTVTVEFEYQS